MKMKVALFSLVILTGCSTPLKPEAMKVRIIENPEFVEKCDFLGPVSESHYSGWNPADNEAQALNAARNIAADMGGNAIRKTGRLWRGVQVDVYKCDFAKLKSP